MATMVVARRRLLERLSPELVREARLLAPFAASIGLYMAAVLAVAQAFGLESRFRPWMYSDIMRISAVLSLPVGLFAYIFYLGFVEREPAPLSRLGDDLRAHILSPSGLMGLALPLVAVPFMISGFSSFKGMIPLLNPFDWDPAFARWDEALHFGIAPWKITHALFGGPLPTLMINFAYNAWFFVMWIFLFCHIFPLAGRVGRARYLLAFSLCWMVVGSIAALFLSSAGPVYYGRVTGLDDVFEPLMARLADIDAGFAADGGYWRIWALGTQERLWDVYQRSATTLGSGISAMPSMHVSIAVLMALAARRLGRRFGWVMTAYAAMIMLGSVHLGWHYAVDGYVAGLLTVVIWRLSGRIVGHASRHPDPSTPPVASLGINSGRHP